MCLVAAAPSTYARAMADDDAAKGQGRTVLVSGASGFVGAFLCEHLRRHDWRVRRLVRVGAARGGQGGASISGEAAWDPERLWVDEGALEGVFGVVHLAGESVIGRWTNTKKQRIRDSRVRGTRALASAITRASVPPSVFVSASAIGYYSSLGDASLTEASPGGDDFLANVCQAWEEESKAVDGTCRRVNPRIGVVLGPGGGALAPMRLATLLGVGGRLGDGKQWVSWISLLDLARMLEFSLVTTQLQGAVNAVAPEPVTNAELTKALAQKLRRPSWLNVPRAALQLTLGEFSQELLVSKRVVPGVAARAGFDWRHGVVSEALGWALGR